MNQIVEEIAKKLEDLLGSKKNGKYILDEKITIDIQIEDDYPFLWIVDERGEYPFAWLFNIEKTENGYKYFCDKYQYIECDSMEKLFDIVKKEYRNI